MKYQESFFTRIKKLFPEDIGGRYLSLVIAEILREDPRIANALFPNLHIKKTQFLQTSVESNFTSSTQSKKRRRADIEVSFLNGLDGPFGRIEVKYEDHNDDSNLNQIKDYIQDLERLGAGRRQLNFTYLTKHTISEDHQIFLHNLQKKSQVSICVLTYRDLFRRLDRIKGPVVDLFLRHLEETTMIYRELAEEELQTLDMIVLKGIRARHAAGFGKQRSKGSIERVPTVLGTLFQNVQVLGDRYREKFQKHFGNTFTVDFVLEPTFSVGSLNHQVKKALREGADHIIIDRQTRSSGELWVVVTGRFKGSTKKGWVNVLLGYSFNLDLNTKTRTYNYFASVWGLGVKRLVEEKPFKKFPSEDVAYKTLSNMLRKLMVKALKQDDLPAAARVRLEKLLQDHHR